MVKRLFLIFFSFIVLFGCNNVVKNDKNQNNPINVSKLDKGFEAIVLKTITGHRRFVFYLDFSKDNKFLASGSADQTVKLWNTSNWNEITTISENYQELWGIPLKISPDSQYLVLGAYNLLKVYKISSKGVNEIAEKTGHEKGIQSIVITSDGKNVITAGVEGDIKQWTLPDLELKKTIKAHSSEVWSVDISPDNTRIISGGEDKLIKVWSFPSLELIKSIKFHDLPIEYVRFSHNGKYFLAASADSRLSVWKTVETGSPYRVFQSHMGSVLVADFTMDDRYIISGGDDDVIYVTDFEKNNIEAVLKEHFGDVMSITVSPDGNYIATGSRDKTIKIWAITH